MATGEVKFISKRREMEIGEFHSLKSKGGERRVKVPVSIPLSNRDTTGLPEWILDGYSFVVKDESLYDKIRCKDTKFEGMSVEFFTTDTVKRKMQGVGGLNGMTMDRFVVERIDEGEKAEVFLSFLVYAPCSKDIIVWMYEFQGHSVFVEFDATQATFSYDGEAGEEEEGDEDQGDLDIPESVIDPNDDPDAPLENDTRAVTKATDPPAKRSHKKKT